jgi:hypothetical protein
MKGRREARPILELFPSESIQDEKDLLLRRSDLYRKATSSAATRKQIRNDVGDAAGPEGRARWFWL